MKSLACFLVLASGCAIDPDSDLDTGKGDGACASPEVQRIARPLDPRAPKAGSFEYAFRLIPGTDPDAPLVIFLPGGPGQTSIESPRDAFAIPARYSLVYTDPRGVGCNA